jgi:hypothetical protein
VQVEHWVAFILANQSASGWLGPDDGFGGQGNTYWNGWNIAAALLQYATVKGQYTTLGSACANAVNRYIAEVHRRMLTTPTQSWSQNRWQDWLYIIDWAWDLGPRGEEQMLLDAGELTKQQSWDWDGYYQRTGVGISGAYVGKVHQ